MYNLAQIRTGDTLLVHGTKFISRAIQTFEKIEDDIAGYWNHSAKFIWVNNILYVVEADYLKKGKSKSKFMAAIKFTNFNNYLKLLEKNEVTLKHLRLKDNYKIDEKEALNFSLKWNGTAYDYENFFSQIYRTIINGLYIKILNKHKVWEKDKNGTKGFICHEWTQFWDNSFLGLFPNWSINAVTPIYYCEAYTHHSII